MPRLILVDDDGRELGSAPVSRENVESAAAFLHRHGAAFRMVASIVREFREVRDALGVTPPASRPRARGGPRVRMRRRG